MMLDLRITGPDHHGFGLTRGKPSVNGLTESEGFTGGMKAAGDWIDSSSAAGQDQYQNAHREERNGPLPHVIPASFPENYRPSIRFKLEPCATAIPRPYPSTHLDPLSNLRRQREPIPDDTIHRSHRRPWQEDHSVCPTRSIPQIPAIGGP